MAIRNDNWIKKMVEEKNMITNFVSHQERNGVISYGLSSCGYDIRIAELFYKMKFGTKPIDPKASSEMDWDIFETKYPFHIQPNNYVLGCSVEHFKIPEDTLVLVIGKSTYARSGLIVNVTPGEPGWEGQWTIELSNPTNRPIRIYPNEGIAQCLFFQANDVADMPYNKKQGKYQNQTLVTLGKTENVL